MFSTKFIFVYPADFKMVPDVLMDDQTCLKTQGRQPLSDGFEKWKLRVVMDKVPVVRKRCLLRHLMT